MRACEVTVVVEGKESISMNHQAHGGIKDAINFKEEILECAEMLTCFCGGCISQKLGNPKNSAEESAAVPGVQQTKPTICQECDGTARKVIHGMFQAKCDCCKGTGKQ